MAKTGTTPHMNRAAESAHPGSALPVPSCRLTTWPTSHRGSGARRRWSDEGGRASAPDPGPGPGRRPGRGRQPGRRPRGRRGDRPPRPARARRARRAAAGARRRLPGRERRLREQHQAPVHLAGRREAPDRRRRRRAAARRRDGLRRRGRHPAVRRRGDPPGEPDHRGHLLAARRRRAGGVAAGHGAAARRPDARPHAGDRRPLGAADARRPGHRPRLPRRQRHLPRARPDHPRPGGRRGQGARSSSAPAGGSSSACTPSSEPPASAASPRSRTSRSWSPTPASARARPAGSPCSDHRWSGPSTASSTSMHAQHDIRAHGPATTGGNSE